jgi:hypothetical protein
MGCQKRPGVAPRAAPSRADRRPPQATASSSYGGALDARAKLEVRIGPERGEGVGRRLGITSALATEAA